MLVSHGGKQKKKTNMLRGRKQTKRPMCNVLHGRKQTKRPMCNMVHGRKQTKRPMCNVLHGKSGQRAPCATCYMTESRQSTMYNMLHGRKQDPHAQHTHYTAEGTDNPHNALAAGKTCKLSCYTLQKVKILKHDLHQPHHCSDQPGLTAEPPS